MTGRCIAIGDIHGCAAALETILTAIAPQKEDLIVILGDVIDRGPNSRKAVELLLELQQHCTLKCVMGNHEEMFLGVMRGKTSPQRWIQFGGASMLDSYGFVGDLSVIPQEHVEFIESFVNYVEADRHFFVHANYEANVMLADQNPRFLRWLTLDQSLPDPHVSGKAAIVGHSADRSGEIFCVRHLKCIDTYCYGGKWLTAMEISTGCVWQANDDGQLRNDKSE
jgi:serine/threonine protein phosphatase 1